jgi:hypothetical protein
MEPGYEDNVVYTSNHRNKEDIQLLLHKAINLIESIKLEDCDCPRAKAIVITKIEEALLWMDYKGRQAPKDTCE